MPYDEPGPDRPPAPDRWWPEELAADGHRLAYCAPGTCPLCDSLRAETTDLGP